MSEGDHERSMGKLETLNGSATGLGARPPKILRALCAFVPFANSRRPRMPLRHGLAAWTPDIPDAWFRCLPGVPGSGACPGASAALGGNRWLGGGLAAL